MFPTSLIDRQSRFNESISRVSSGQCDNGIGTYSEKMTHRVIKDYIEPVASYHESRVGGYVADIKVQDQIYEVQSKDFYRLKNKISSLLKHYKVQLIYPVVVSKQIRWVDPITKCVIESSKSTKHMHESHILTELYGIRDILNSSNLTFRVICLEEIEFKYLDGHGINGRNGATKINRIPTKLINDIEISSVGDIVNLLNIKRGQEFTADEFRKLHRMREPYKALGALTTIGLVVKVGKVRNRTLYKLV